MSIHTYGKDPVAIYLYSCPNCGRSTGDDRLYVGLPCPRCLSELVEAESKYELAQILEKKSILREGSEIEYYSRIEKELAEVENLFEKATGSRLWSAQRTWVKRVLKGRSFALIAPTGLGKTTFGVLMALYFALRGEKSYIVVPTTPLVKMVYSKLEELALKTGREVRVIAFYSGMKFKEKEDFKSRLESGEFDVLITTSKFMLSRYKDMIRQGRKWRRWFKFIFVDDVDAVLKSSKSVTAVLNLVGFDERDIEDAWELLRLRNLLPRRLEQARRLYDKKVSKLKKKVKEGFIGVPLEEIRRVRRETFEEVVSETYNRLVELENKLQEKRAKASILVVSSATGRPRGRQVRLFQVLLGFQAGSATEVMRNIVDAYVEASSWREVEERVLEIVKYLDSKLPGGLVYVPVDKGAEYAEDLAEKLRSSGIRAEAFTARSKKALEKFISGEIRVLVGVAIYYGVAVRGLDLPETISYAVFVGVPRHKFGARLEHPHPLMILNLLVMLSEHGPEDVAEKAQSYLALLRPQLTRLSPAALAIIAKELRESKPTTPLSEKLMEATNWLRRTLEREDVWEKLRGVENIAIIREDGETYLLLPDIPTYIQASGRTSRLYAGGITRGLSIVVSDNPRLLRGLIQRTRWLVDADWRRLEEIDLDHVIQEIKRDRERVREVRRGAIKPEQLELVKTALLVVESPNKARTIARFFGRPSIRRIGSLTVYEVSTGDYLLLVTASGGHVYDLAKPELPSEEIGREWLLKQLRGSLSEADWGSATNIQGIVVVPRRNRLGYYPVYAPLARCLACNYQWSIPPKNGEEETLKSELVCPLCGSRAVRSSMDIIEALRDLASEVDVVLIGTDPDTEGEKIGYDLASLIGPAAQSIVRIEFHEVTRRALLRALEKFRPFNENLVKAQIVRRIEDRWIGFTLSPLLWAKFWPQYCMMRMKKKIAKTRNIIDVVETVLESCRKPNYNLSAGRTQTPVLGWIVEATLGNKYLRIPLYRFNLEGPAGEKIYIEVRGDEISSEIKEALENTQEKLYEVLRKHKILEGREELEKLRREKLKVIYSYNKALEEAVKEGRIVGYVEVVDEVERELNPLPPFTTDTMLSEASSELGLSAPTIMKLAQDLFELGLITYHRTDSTRISSVGISVAEEYLKSLYGEALGEVFRPSHWGEEGAHEAIRPTKPIDVRTLRRLVEEGAIQLARPLTRSHYRLYDLIFRRFIASQMKPARVKVQKARIKLVVEIEGREPVEVVREEERIVEVVVDSWLSVYRTIKPREKLVPGKYTVTEVKPRPWSPKSLLTQSEVVRMMRERGIGRPSTYAAIIDTLLRRNYVILKGRQGYLIATMRGIGVYDYLAGSVGELVEEETTRKLQSYMDKIEKGVVDYEEVIKHIYTELEKTLSSYKVGLSREEFRRLLPEIKLY